MKAKTLAVALAAACLAGAAGLPAARADENHVEARKLRESGEILPLETIAERARAARSGEIIETELERGNGGYVYEVEILDESGTVWELKLNAKSGELIEMERDD